MEDLKLKIELVPKSAQYANFRNAVKRSVWENIAKKTKEGQDNKCAICGDQCHRLYCHEIWEYDDSHFIYTLIGFVSLCGYCHSVKHMGHTKILAEQGLVDLEEVIAHFCKVNGCTKAEYKQHEKEAFLEYHARSQYKWEPDFGEYTSALLPHNSTRPQSNKSLQPISFDCGSDTDGKPSAFTFSNGLVCSPSELLRYLFSNRYRGKQFVFANFENDEESILYNILPATNLKELGLRGKTEWNGYRFRFKHKKELVIAKGHHSMSISSF